MHGPYLSKFENLFLFPKVTIYQVFSSETLRSVIINPELSIELNLNPLQSVSVSKRNV